MTVESTLEHLSSSLPEWSHKGLNEAQTSQVIVLRVFQALGYDIWNPFEVAPQLHSGGGGGAYAPDFAVHLNGTYFVVEVKALDKDFSPNDRMQPVNYVNALGRRWAVLTNGKVWHFYDNRIDKPAAEKLALTVDSQDARAATYLKRLLSREVWSKADVEQSLAAEVQAINQEIRRHLELGHIETKLRLEMQTGLTLDEQGLRKAIRLALEPNERELAEESFTELTKRLLDPTDQSPNILKVLFESIERAVPNERKNRPIDVHAWLDGKELGITSCRDLTVGITEAMIALGQGDKLVLYKTTDEYHRKDGRPYPPHEYRQLSNRKYLMLHSSAAEHIRRCRKMLAHLSVAPQTLRVEYRNETFYLP